jgi:hypothetical protein
MTVNGGVAEVIIRIARGVSRSARYVTSESVVPVLQWCCRPHTGIAELRLKLLILLKLESLRRSQCLFNLFRSQIRFTASGVEMRIFQPKEIKNSLGRFGPMFYIGKNTRFPQCCVPTLLRSYMEATKECAAVQAPTSGGLLLVEDRRLFVALQAPCRPVKANTLASLGTSVLAALHVHGTSHILRGMASSHMIKAGADKGRVLIHMNITEKTFDQFYWRPPREEVPQATGPNALLSDFLWAWV